MVLVDRSPASPFPGHSALAVVALANGLRSQLAVFPGPARPVAELCALDCGDLHITSADGAGLLLVRRKGKKDRLVPGPPAGGLGHYPVTGRGRAHPRAELGADVRRARRRRREPQRWSPLNP
jgi:hypothetical protein